MSAASRDDSSSGAPTHTAETLKPEQQQGLDHLKSALQEVSNEPGATVHYAVAGSSPPPQLDADNIGTMTSNLEGRDFIVSPSADGRKVDVVERIDLPDAGAIRTDVKTGFGAHEGPISPDAMAAAGKGAGGT